MLFSFFVPFLPILEFHNRLNRAESLFHPIMIRTKYLQPLARLLGVLYYPLIRVDPACLLVLPPVTRPIISDVIQMEHLDCSDVAGRNATLDPALRHNPERSVLEQLIAGHFSTPDSRRQCLC